MAAPKSGEVEFKTVWRDPDDKVIGDAIALWQEVGALPPEITPEERAAELLYAGYIDGELACVATAEIIEYHQVHQKLAFTRYLTAPDFREHDLFTKGALFGHEWLSDWAQSNPDEQLAGTLWTWNPMQEFYGRPAPPYWPRRGESRQGIKHCILTGYTSDGIGIWTWWFAHMRV